MRRALFATLALAGCADDEATAVASGPVVERVVPSSGSARGGEEVVIEGKRLAAASAVRFGELSAEFEAVDEATIRAVTPRAIAGEVDVAVDAPDASDGGAVLEAGFRFQPLDVRFSDHSARLGVAGLRARDAAEADLDGDGDTDVAFAVRLGPNRVLVNNAGSLRDESVDALPPEYGWRDRIEDTIGLAAADFDADGDVDLFFANYAGEQDRLYLNDGSGVFEDATDRLPADAAWGHAAVAADLDGDGDLDVAVATYSPAEGVNRVYLWQPGPGGWTFTWAQTALPPDDGATAHLAAADVDGDGDVDLLAANDQPDRPLRLYLNDGDAAFAEAPPGFLPAQAESARRAIFGDVDGDGDVDLLAQNRGQDRLYVNDGTGRFADATYGALPVDASSPGGGRLVDLDRDGDLDFVAATDVQDRVYLNDGFGRFEDWTGFAMPLDDGPGDDVAVLDLDDDGDMDLVITQEDGEPVLLYVFE